MGTGYIGDATSHHSISENLPSLTSKYPLRNGYFGKKGQGRDFTRNIASSDPLKTAKDFFVKAAYGGVRKDISNGIVGKMADGTIVSFKDVSSSDGSPAVEINIRKSSDNGGLKYQKIHFIKEEAK